MNQNEGGYQGMREGERFAIWMLLLMAMGFIQQVPLHLEAWLFISMGAGAETACSLLGLLLFLLEGVGWRIYLFGSLNKAAQRETNKLKIRTGASSRSGEFPLFSPLLFWSGHLSVGSEARARRREGSGEGGEEDQVEMLQAFGASSLFDGGREEAKDQERGKDRLEAEERGIDSNFFPEVPTCQDHPKAEKRRNFHPLEQALFNVLISLEMGINCLALEWYDHQLIKWLQITAIILIFFFHLLYQISQIWRLRREERGRRFAEATTPHRLDQHDERSTERTQLKEPLLGEPRTSLIWQNPGEPAPVSHEHWERIRARGPMDPPSSSPSSSSSSPNSSRPTSPLLLPASSKIS